MNNYILQRKYTRNNKIYNKRLPIFLFEYAVLQKLLSSKKASKKEKFLKSTGEG